MGHIEVSKNPTATADQLWAVIADPQTWEKWFTLHAGWLAEAPSTVTVGTKLVEKIVMLGMANKIEWDVTEVDEGTTLTLAGTGMAGVKVEFSFRIAPAETGSTFTIIGDFEGALIKGALGKAVEKDFDKQLDTSIAQLDALAAA